MRTGFSLGFLVLGTATSLSFKEDSDIGNWCANVGAAQGYFTHNMVKNNLILGTGVLIWDYQ